jgi:hypothetical protein
MKVTVVPAQVTTVEDRIAGTLGLSQVLLLVAPIFLGAALYAVLPPNLHVAIYKLVVIIVLALTCSLLAIRIKGKIVLFWLVVVLSYNLRPRYYLYNKNSLLHREQYQLVSALETETDEETETGERSPLARLSVADTARVHAFLDNPAANLTFENTKKGGLYVRITEIKEQS